jgi:hypothetical protein
MSETARIEVLRRLSKLNKARFDEQPQSSSAAKPANANGASIEDDVLEDDLFADTHGKTAEPDVESDPSPSDDLFDHEAGGRTRSGTGE